MLTALLIFAISVIVICAVAYILQLLWEWACTKVPVPSPLVEIVRILIWVVAVVAVLWKAVPLVRALGV